MPAFISASVRSIFLQHNVSNVNPQASLGLDRKGGLDVHFLSASAGVMLQHDTPEELIWVMLYELAHAIAQHGNEHVSWLQLGRLLLFAWILLTPVGVWASFLAWPVYLVLATVGNSWVSQQMEYDADAMGAVISKAAGCSSAAIISCMQRFHANSMLDMKAQFPERAKAFDSQTKVGMAALQCLLPDTQLPDFSFSSRGVFQAVQQALTGQSPEVQQQAAVTVARLEKLQGERLFLLSGGFLGDLDRMVGTHPDWSERIKRVHQMLTKLSSEPTLHADIQLPHCLDGASTAMQMYQSGDNWCHLWGKQREEWHRSEQVRKMPAAC